MNVEETIRNSIINYPRLFANRASVLDHLFYVVGNGFEWFNGELVDPFEESKPHWEHKIKDYIDSSLDENVKKILREKRQKQIALEQKIRDQVNFRAKDMSPYQYGFHRRIIPISLYPESSYSKINNIPDDVQPDWLKASEQIKAFHKIWSVMYNRSKPRISSGIIKATRNLCPTFNVIDDPDVKLSEWIVEPLWEPLNEKAREGTITSDEYRSLKWLDKMTGRVYSADAE